MTAIYNLRASNNATFCLTRDLSQWAAIHDLASATLRMQARLSPFAPDPPAYQWATGSSSGGAITFDPATKLCVFVAPLSDMARLPSPLFYDCRLEMPDGSTAIMFAGRIVFDPGVTRMTADGMAAGVSIGDTVMVDGEASSMPAALPAVVTPTNFGAAFESWFNALPTSPPAIAGQFWNNGGMLAKS